MYKSSQNIVFGFHAASENIAKKLVENGDCEFKPSKNTYDWLGSGMYFWENSVHRAEKFARDRKIENPVVIGAAIQLGYCLDLTDSESLSYLNASYQTLKATAKAAGAALPKNKPGNRESEMDLLLRELDCAVINFLHSQRKDKDEKVFDSVRGVFWEGKALYPGAGFKEKNHIQICIINPNCIKGFFYPRQKVEIA